MASLVVYKVDEESSWAQLLDEWSGGDRRSAGYNCLNLDGTSFVDILSLDVLTRYRHNGRE